MNRRDLLIGGACAAALGTAEYLRPRRTLNLLGEAKLDQAVPKAFSGWSSERGGDIVVPQNPGSLADRLYSQQVIRSYSRPDRSNPVMLVIAYGSSQSDLLQLHRPESCYPAVGFEIVERRLVDIPIAPGVTVPGVALTAEAQGRREDIVYWSRLGEFLPQTAGQQRRDRLSAAFDGYVGDGVLVRASMVRLGADPVHDRVATFLSSMMNAMPPAQRSALIGTARSQALV